MRHIKEQVLSGLILLLLVTGLSWAGIYDFNPGQVPVKHKNDVTSDVQGEGYFVEYANVNTNNLSMLNYAHGSGTMDFADILYDEQKTTSKSIYYIDYDTWEWKKGQAGASSRINYTRQYDNVQSPTNFAYGTGWYASHPVTYNSLLKDKNEAKSYQEATSMHRQIEYARAVKGDISVDINCTAPTATVDGKGSMEMKVDDDVTQGTLHIGELVANPKLTYGKELVWDSTKKKYTEQTIKDLYGHFEALNDPIVDIENEYIGNFKVQKTMKVEMIKSAPTWAEDWLPCCSGGFFEIPSYNFDADRGSQKGIFDCTCRNTSISTMKPKWNTSLAQFPAAKYQRMP
jgi:hypothetical protein